MKTTLFAALLLLLLVAQTYGIYGATQAQKLTVDCTLSVSVLCFRWEENRLGKLLGKERSEELEKLVVKQREAWEQTFVREQTKDSPSLTEQLKDAGSEAKRHLREALDAFSEQLKRRVNPKHPLHSSQSTKVFSLANDDLRVPSSHFRQS